MTQRNFFPAIDQLTDSDQFVLFHERQILVRGNNFVWHRSELEMLSPDELEILLIDEHPNAPVLAINAKSDVSRLLQAEYRPLRTLLATEDDRAFAMAGKANQIMDWYASHRFCGVCGSRTEHHPTQRAMICPHCAQQFFPRINPCVIMLVTRGDEILLARNARFKSGYFSCLAGFIEVGETPEQTVARETREEVGIEVENIRYARSQSWPFPSQLMLGFYAEYRSGDIVLEVDEIEEAHWFRVDRLPAVPPASISVAGELIRDHVTRIIQRLP